MKSFRSMLLATSTLPADNGERMDGIINDVDIRTTIIRTKTAKPGAKQPEPQKEVVKSDGTKGSSEMSKTAQKKSFATPLEQMTISNALAQYCSAGENGYAKYVDGMSEEKLISDVIIPALSKAGKFSEDRRNAIEKRVKHLRTSVFGNLRQASHGTNQYTMAVEKIDGIIERLTVLEGRFAKLVQTLGADA